MRPSTHSASSFLLLCSVFLQTQPHTDKMHIAVDLDASFAVHAGSCVWRLLSFFVAMRRMEREGVRSPRLLSCGCGAPRVAGVVGARSVCVVWWPRFLPFPWGCSDELGEMVVDVFSSCMVGGCWRCVPSLRGCRLVVCELCGWACCPLLMLSALSRCIRGAPSISLIFYFFSFCSLRVTMTAIMTVRRRVVPCAVVLLLLVRVYLTAAGSPGDVSGDADAVVVPVDVSCASSDGSLSYRVYGCGRIVLQPVLRLSMRIILSVDLMCACMAGMVSWVLCAMWPMRCTRVATVLPAVQRKRKRPPLPSR
ncbi:hypothetical protein TCDM_10225 [Trypanosoma cruzi Dm28c]|uniref:Uncharacterized protein n=1 Tax=Trypanosoma cruzi Dm28c TaxID=1416333 RepID=V5AN57_TRYCR|nr:hypothetical protein TCDM_10225 [Trypanosoma cruzi Dm28c]